MENLSCLFTTHTADIVLEGRVRRISQHHRPQDVLPSSVCFKFRDLEPHEENDEQRDPSKRRTL